MSISWIVFVGGRITLPVIAGIALGVVMIIAFAIVFNSPSGSNSSTLPRISSRDTIHIVENELQRFTNEVGMKYGVDYRITDIAIDVPKFANYTLTYVSFKEFEEKNMKLPLVYVNSNGTVFHILENGSSEYVGECHTGLFTYCGSRPPFELGYEGRLVYGMEVLALSKDNLKESLFYIVDAMNGEIVDSTHVRYEKVQQGLKLPPT